MTFGAIMGVGLGLIIVIGGCSLGIIAALRDIALAIRERGNYDR